MVLITGINGFIGSHIARLLIKKGVVVRGLIRAKSNLSNLSDIKSNIRLIEGDILDPPTIRKAFEGVDTCYHTAALVKVGRHSRQEYFSANLNGTINVCDAAMRTGVRKFVHTSTCETLRAPMNDRGRGPVIIQESISNTLADMLDDYGRSKFMAEEHIKARAMQGLPAVIVNPTGVIGPGDINTTPPGYLLRQYCTGKIPVYFKTGFNVVDVRDVAAGHILALQNGRIGERYILGGTNIYLNELFKVIKEITHTKKISVRLPYWLIELGFRLSRNKFITPQKLKASRQPFFLSSAKAEKELGWRRSFELQATLKDALA